MQHALDNSCVGECFEYIERDWKIRKEYLEKFKVTTSSETRSESNKIIIKNEEYFDSRRTILTFN